MNEQQHPEDRPDAIGADDPTPRHPDAPDADASDIILNDADEPTARSRGRGILRPILIGTGAAAVVLAVAGVGLSIADAFDDDEDPVPAASTSATAEPGDDRDDDSAAAVDGTVPAEPADLAAAIEAAVTAAGGGDATSVEVERDGWKVDIRLADGSEVEVRVPLSGDPVVRADDDGDGSSDVPLDPSRIAAISDAAIAAAGGGVVVSIETEDDADVRFDVEVELGGEDVDVELAEDLSVISADR
ncbi:hypothetical protein L332_12485 [Agrococcus pavilionensis RW1]|uniref:PepSY domain-containing protein n=1 Tax=Agrococcus pavilionensis RW1 TaxID=1330458 RepID=U1LT25_9MICO|nr:hypothetical protein [Agrococcus pavilionensis]ERG65252.1 hypothetical protein L332_12485 [Agrococcus pavilionensis RW1]